MSCKHTDDMIAGQVVRNERTDGTWKAHAYVICSGCSERVWVHVVGTEIVEGHQMLLVERCDNPPIEWAKFKRLGLPDQAFKPEPLAEN